MKMIIGMDGANRPQKITSFKVTSNKVPDILANCNGRVAPTMVILSMICLRGREFCPQKKGPTTANSRKGRSMAREHSDGRMALNISVSMIRTREQAQGRTTTQKGR